MTLDFPIIKTDRLLLRKFEQADLHNVFKGLSHPDVIRYYGVHFDTVEAAQEQMDWFRDHEKNETGQWFAICSADNQFFYGAGGLNDVKKEHKKAEIGFWLLPDFWQQGIMTEAMPLICCYAFNHMDIHRIEGYVESDNLNCKKALKKLDFKHEGTMKDCEIKNGRFISLDIYSKLRVSS